MFHTYVVIVCSKYFSFASVVCCIQVFNALEVESHGEHGLGAGGWGAERRGPTVGARNASRILRTGRACPHAGSRALPA
jgi:hypothetical protein